MEKNKFDDARDEMLAKLKDIVAEKHPGEEKPQDTVDEVVHDA
jgi:hypothetical protein